MQCLQRSLNLGWAIPLGAEYKPTGATEHSLDWLNSLSDGRR